MAASPGRRAVKHSTPGSLEMVHGSGIVVSFSSHEVLCASQFHPATPTETTTIYLRTATALYGRTELQISQKKVISQNTKYTPSHQTSRDSKKKKKKKERDQLKKNPKHHPKKEKKNAFPPSPNY
jgi:hypothetical protein